MGAWGSKIFEDDATLDWLNDFQHAGSSFSMLQMVFDRTLEMNYLDYEDAAAALSAAEVVAAAFGRPSEDYLKRTAPEATLGKPVDLKRLKAHISADFLKKATAAVRKANDPKCSELASLWAGDEERSTVVQNLLERFQPA